MKRKIVESLLRKEVQNTIDGSMKKSMAGRRLLIFGKARQKALKKRTCPRKEKKLKMMHKPGKDQPVRIATTPATSTTNYSRANGSRGVKWPVL